MRTRVATLVAVLAVTSAPSVSARLAQRLIDGDAAAAAPVRVHAPHAPAEYVRDSEREPSAADRTLWAAAPQAAATPPTPVDEKTTVYVTRTGKLYHAAGCRHLARSQIPMELGKAVARYGACSVCKPATLTPSATPVPAVSTPKPTTPSASVHSGRCQATTKRGTQCSRNAQAGRNYCWQH